MNIKKCDGCEQTIKDRDFLRVEVNAGSFDFFELCQKCAQPIIKILKTKKIIKNEK